MNDILITVKFMNIEYIQISFKFAREKGKRNDF